MEQSIVVSLKSKKIDVVIVPGGCTKNVQAPDGSWNKPFKSNCTELYDEWLSEEGIMNETEVGNLKQPPRKKIIEWILDAWNSFAEYFDYQFVQILWAEFKN